MVVSTKMLSISEVARMLGTSRASASRLIKGLKIKVLRSPADRRKKLVREDEFWRALSDKASDGIIPGWALKRAERLREELLAMRGGKPFSDSTWIISRFREEERQ